MKRPNVSIMEKYGKMSTARPSRKNEEAGPKSSAGLFVFRCPNGLFGIFEHHAPVEFRLSFDEYGLGSDSLDYQPVLGDIVFSAENVEHMSHPLFAQILVAFLASCILVGIAGDHEYGIRILLDDIPYIEIKLEKPLGIEFGLSYRKEHGTGGHGKLPALGSSHGIAEISVFSLDGFVFPGKGFLFRRELFGTRQEIFRLLLEGIYGLYAIRSISFRDFNGPLPVGLAEIDRHA